MESRLIAPYRPLTARPYLRDSTYAEHLPCKPLRPYVACFWGGEGTGRRGPDRPIRVIPDTCVDIIVDINHANQTMTSRLCGIQDCSVMVEQGSRGENVTRFAVRFYFWTARLFLNLDFSDLYNQTVDLELLKPGCNAEFEPLIYCRSLRERIAWMEPYLLSVMNMERGNPNLYNSIDYLLRSRGGAPAREICEYSTISQRQMERLFKREIGISVKRTASLVRYQHVWREVVRQERFDVQEAVGRYGYSDQSHLLNEFKRFHDLWPSQAKQEALESR